MSAPARALRSFAATPLSAPAEKPPHERIRTRRKQAWLALHFHDWALHAALDKLEPAERAAYKSQPTVVLDDDRQRRVLACNAVAWRHGIRPGHTLNAAIALYAETHFLPRDLPRETRLLEAAAAWAQQYTPVSSIEAPHELLLEVRGSLRLFGGASALVEKITQELHEREIETSAVLSATARSALWLARQSAAMHIVPPRMLKAQLGALSIHCLQWPQDIELRLYRFGVHTIGDLLRLPRADLARRIGSNCMRELDEALGRRHEVRQSFSAPEPYVDRVILDFEIETHVLLEPLLIMRLEKLQTFLRARNLIIGELSVELLHRESLCTPLRVGLAMPTADMQHVSKLMREQLAQLVLPAPVIEVRLTAERLLAAHGASADLFQSGAAAAQHLTREERLGRLLEQLRARLGTEAICALRTQADHRPEKAQLGVSAEVSSPAQKFLLTSMQRPLWLLHEPQRLGPGPHAPADLHLLRGPERIEAGWWDGSPAQRDYFMAKNSQGAWCWVYRNLEPPFEWYLHGLFA